MALLGGDVLNIRRHQNSIYVPKMGVLVLTLFSRFYTRFFGDLSYFLGKGGLF
jgi:hypothetical protein